MVRHFSKIAILCGLVFSGSLFPTVVLANADKIETGRLLAILLDTGRVTVGMHQALINDPQKGFKGFTPELFSEQVVTLYKDRTGIDLLDLENASISDEAKSLLTRLLEESRKTVQSYQPVINISGVTYKGLIPATFGTETAKRFKSWTQVYLKQTAPDHLLRNPQNKADGYEADVMKTIETSGRDTRRAIFSQTVAQENSVRVMLPLYYEKSCLSCHGGPKGEQDISGYKKEGGKEGDLAGTISVKLPLHDPSTK